MIISIFYSKETGEIYTHVVAQNIYDFSHFGAFENEFKKILSVVYVQYNEFLANNIKLYKVDVATRKVVLKEDIEAINTL